MYRPEYVESIEEYVESLKKLGRKGVHVYVYNRESKNKTAFIHFSNNVEIWDLVPGLWKGWRLMFFLDEKEMR